MSSHIDKSAIDTARIAFEDAFKELVKLVETGAGKKELGHAAARYKFLMVHH